MAASRNPTAQSTTTASGSVIAELEQFDLTGNLGPLLTSLLATLLTIEPTSVNNERQFSTAKLIITSQRHLLSNSHIDMIHFLHSFLKNNIE